MNINVNLNAYVIQRNLDLKDGTGDGCIEKSIWDSFADITGGKHINNRIEYSNAMKSINSYLRRASEETINKICEFFGWQSSTSEVQEDIDTSDKLLEQTAADSSMVADIEIEDCADGTTMKTANLNDGRWVRAVYSEDGELESLIVASEEPTEEYPVQPGYITYNKESIGVNNENNECVYAPIDVTSEEYDFAKYQKLAEQIFGANIPEDAKECFKLSTDVLNDAVNMNPKPEVYDSKHAGEDCKECKLPNGEYIRVFYDSNGEIEGIMVSYSSEEEELSDGSMGDGAEAYFTSDFANYNANSSINGWDGEVTSGYDFEELKALAEQIFG